MTTHPEDTRNNFPRDMQWGQAIQLIEDHTKASMDRTSIRSEHELTSVQTQTHTDWFRSRHGRKLTSPRVGRAPRRDSSPDDSGEE